MGGGGSGRQSLSRIATFMAEFKQFSIEISKNYTTVEWREDLRRVLKQAGAQFQPTVFLFSDSQMKDESFLEDINNILNTGEVPSLFPKVWRVWAAWGVWGAQARGGAQPAPQGVGGVWGVQADGFTERCPAGSEKCGGYGVWEWVRRNGYRRG